MDNDTIYRLLDATAANAIWEELRKARTKYPREFASPHEGYAILLEEMDELWAAIKNNDQENMAEEAMHVGAMAVRLLTDCYFIGKQDPSQGGESC